MRAGRAVANTVRFGGTCAFAKHTAPRGSLTAGTDTGRAEGTTGCARAETRQPAARSCRRNHVWYGRCGNRREPHRPRTARLSAWHARGDARGWACGRPTGIFAYLNYDTPRERQYILNALVVGLERLEYRGYDSAGTAIARGTPPPNGVLPRR